MKLYVVRHGIALDIGEEGITRDADRTLSPEGGAKTAQAAAGLARLGCRPERVATSPLPRAEETARIMAEALCPQVRVELCDSLEPGAATRDVVDWLGRDPQSDAMIVGHMPDVARITSELLCGADRLDVTFKKAATCSIEFDGAPQAGEGRLEWLLQPRALREVGKRQD